ncbi:MAG: transcription antitermination factor NusB [Acidobacteriaceae bacterium]
MIAPARQISYRILLQIAATDAHSDELLRSREVDALSPQDRNLTTTLVLGTLRWQLALDARIRPLLARPNAKLSPEAATALRLGAFQLLHLDRIPAHAAINDSVELVKASSEKNAAGMVNAVLRKIAAQPRPVLPERFSSPQEVAAALGHPVWMVERWAARYGLAAAEAIGRWNQEPAAVTVRLSDAASPTADLQLEPGAFLANARRVLQGNVARHPALRVQDEASQLVAEIAATAVSGAANVLDTCAAPGGKTAILAERLPAAQITAVDVSRKRLDAMKSLLARSLPDVAGQTRLHFQVADATRLSLKSSYDLILCDVPCSGTGTIARNPEIRFRVDPADLPRQQARQLAILKSSLAALAPSGRLVYSTCSLEPEENESVIAAVLRELPEFRIVPVAPLLDRLTAAGILTPRGRELLRTAANGDFLRTLPGVHPCDGFFAAILERA